MKTCRRCLQVKDLEDFALNRSAPDGRNDRCRACFREIYQLDREARLQKMAARRLPARARAREWVASYLREHSCVDCGSTDLRCLEFDHRPGESKRWDVSRMVGGAYDLETIKAEVAKCDVRCANCHRRATAERRGSARHVAELQRLRALQDEAVTRLRALSETWRTD